MGTSISFPYNQTVQAFTPTSGTYANKSSFLNLSGRKKKTRLAAMIAASTCHSAQSSNGSVWAANPEQL